MRRLLFLLCVLLLCGPSLLLSCAHRGTLGLKTYAYAGGQQQEGKIAYAETPPVGGAYSPLWQRCGVYTAPIYDEYAVHSLERGAFWITYSPGLPAAEVAKLQALLAQPRSRKDGSKAAPPGLLSPRGGLKTPVALTVWNAQVQVGGADDPRLGQMLDQYSLESSAPEAGAGCGIGYSGTQ